jgi:hypothetical protein
MSNHGASNRHLGDHFHASPRRFSSTLCLLTVFLGGCDVLPRPGDTTGVQNQARWVIGRLVVDTDPRLTIVRLDIDTAPGSAGHDVLLARFDFDPSGDPGGAYSISLGLDFGRLRDLSANTRYQLGPPPAGEGRIPAYATVTCLCRPLRPDSVRGTYELSRHGIAQITGRMDARLYFTAWNDSTQHAVYRLRQRIEGLK